MGQKKDIGKLFENKLKHGEKQPNKSVWEKLDVSLDAEKRKREKIIYYWLIGTSVVFLLGLVLLINSESVSNSNIPSNTKNIITTEASHNENINHPESKMSISDTLFSKAVNEEVLSKIDDFDIDSDVNSKINVEKTESNLIKENSKKRSSKINEEEYQVSKNYYYYNSKDGKQLVTHSKKEIDSLIAEQRKSKDSLSTKNTDEVAD